MVEKEHIGVIAVIVTVWIGIVSWLLRLITPEPMVKLPKIVLASDVSESVRANVPDRVARP